MVASWSVRCARLRHSGLVLFALLLACLFVLAASKSAHAQNASCGEPQRTQGTIVLERCIKRTFNVGGQEKTVIVYFTTTNGSAADRLRAVDADGDPANGNERSADALATFIADWTVSVWQRYRAYGFPDPMGRSDMKVHIFDMRPGLAGWCCTADNYEIEAPHVVAGLSFGGDALDVEATVYHEMWHASRWSGSFGCWTNEGGASHMSDHVNLPVDNDAANDYIGRVWGYLSGGYQNSLTDHCYDAALWWQYFSERTSTGTDPVARGVDSVKAFWDDPAATDLTRMDNVIRARAAGETFESIWIDFAVANIAKDLTGAGVADKYRYFDETHAGAPDYPAPTFSGTFNLTPTSPVIPTLDSVNAWSAQYYQFFPTAAVPVINVEVRQELNRRVAYSLLVIDNNGIVREERSVGRNFSLSLANNSYDRIVLVVVGLNEQANFRYSVNASMALNIVDPLTARRVRVGDPAAPEKMLIKVDLFAGAGGGPISGVEPASIAITVGTTAVQPADRISAAYIQGQYWLLVRAPVQSAPGSYNLTVSYAGLSDTENLAVEYAPRADASTVVVLDRSGSMNDFGKLQAAKDAARLYIDSWRDGDQIGVASFNENATINLNLGSFAAERTNAFNAINGLAGAGNTSIGDGAQIAMQNLIDRDLSARPWSIMLLSDGIENEDIRIATFLENYNARRNASPAQKVPQVIAVALGPDADRARMENLAAATGGVYYVAAVPTNAAAAEAQAEPTAIEAVRLSNDLAEIFRSGSEFIAGQQQVGALSRNYNDPLPIQFPFQISGAPSEAIFVVKWDQGVLGLSLRFRDPNGTLSAPLPTEFDSRHLVYRFPAPMPGQWTVLLIAPPGPRAAGLELPNEVMVEAAVVSDLTLNAFLGLPVQERLVGKPMPIFAGLSDAAPLSGATVNAFITGPQGFYSVSLRDDGAHGDGAANDGFYGGTFYQTQAHGAYDVVVTATGTGSDGEPFVRRVRLGFNMLQSRFLDFDPNFPDYDPNYPVDWNNPNDPNRGRVDKDNDRLIDWWERETGLDPDNSIPDQANQDPDFDGLSNQEEFERGTDPLSSDTDKGGQNDGSEVTGGLDPLDPATDQTPCPRYFQARSSLLVQDEYIYTGAIVLTYEVDPDHTSFSLWRRVGEGTREFVTDQLPATGVYSDTNVTEGTTYHYWIWANDAQGNASCVLGPSSATLDPDAPPPQGIVQINNGAAETLTSQVTLQINATEDAMEMQVRHSVAAFDEAQGWEPYKTTKPWTLAPVGSTGVVFVFFRDAAGNVSAPAVDTIEVTAAGSIYLPLVNRQ